MADRVRGGYPEGRRPKWARDAAKVLAGMVIALQVSSAPQWLILAGISVALISWRHDNGWRGKWVRAELGQFHYLNKQGIMKGFTWLDMVKDSMQWGLFASIGVAWLGFINITSLLLIPAFMLGTPLAMVASMKIRTLPVMQARSVWSVSELIELPIIILLYHVIVIIANQIIT
jgi:hypothetical protein